MAMTALASDLDHGGSLLDDTIRTVRIAHAEKLAASSNIRDAAVLRLQVLKDELAPLFIGNAAARRIVDLALVPGTPPRLWIDMTSYVIMAPNASTYRLQRDSFCRHDVLLESEDRGKIVTAVLQHVASHLIEREKQLALVMAAERVQSGNAYQRTPLMLAWASGLALGISLMAALIGWASG